MKVDTKIMKKRAQSLVEYGLILALVAVVAIATLQLLGKKVNEAAEKSGDSVINTTDNAAKAYCDALGDDYSWTVPEGAENSTCVKVK